MTDEKAIGDEIRKIRIEHKKLELEYVKFFLTFCSIVVAIEIFIIGNSNFDSNFKLMGLIILAFLLLYMGFFIRSQLGEIKHIFFD